MIIGGLPCNGHSAWQVNARKAPLFRSALTLGSRAERTPEIGSGNLEGDLNLEHLGAHRSRANDLGLHRILPRAVHQKQLLPAADSDAENEENALRCGIDGLCLLIKRVLVRPMPVNIYG